MGVNMNKLDKVKICKVVAGAIMADLQIKDEERELLDKLMDRYELSEAQRREALARNIDESPEPLLHQLTTDESRSELLVELALAVAVDGEISPPEQDMLARVAKVLDVTPDGRQGDLVVG